MKHPDLVTAGCQVFSTPFPIPSKRSQTHLSSALVSRYQRGRSVQRQAWTNVPSLTNQRQRRKTRFDRNAQTLVQFLILNTTTSPNRAGALFQQTGLRILSRTTADHSDIYTRETGVSLGGRPGTGEAHEKRHDVVDRDMKLCLRDMILVTFSQTWLISCISYYV